MQGAGFSQLLAKTCAALLLGWHAYALLLPFVILGLAGALARRWKRQVGWASVRRYLILGTVSLGFGVIVLGINFAREYFALGGERPLAELPSVYSMLRRTGIAEFASSGDWTWGWSIRALGEQFRRVGAASVPAMLHMFSPGKIFLAMLGAAVSLSTVGLLCLRSTPYCLPQSALVLAGFHWALLISDGIRGHDFYGMFYLGVPLVFLSLVPLRLKMCVSRVHDPNPSPFAWIRRTAMGVGARPAIVWMVAAATIFVASARVVAEGKAAAQDVEVERALTAEMHAIRPLVKNKVVLLRGFWFRLSGVYIWWHRLIYSLTGNSVIVLGRREFADFFVAPRFEGFRSLAPENQHVFLYRPADVDAVYLSYEHWRKRDSPS